MNRTLLVITGVLGVMLVFAVGVIAALVWLRPGGSAEPAGGAQLGVWYDANGTAWELLPNGELIITQGSGQVQAARYSVSAERILLRLDTNASAELLTGVAEVVFDCDWRERAVLRCSATAGEQVIPLVLAREVARARAEQGGEGMAEVPEAAPTATAVGVLEGLVDVPAGAGVAAFRIGRTEVTNAQYAQCVAAGACTVPVVPEGVAASLRESGYPEKYWVSRYGDAAYAEHPAVWVTREQARAYAAWAGGRLPTEAEWMRACQGDDGRTYPWGEAAPDGRLANFYDPAQDGDTSDNDVGDTTSVGSYPAGASPYGALDMAGNVWEWVEADDGDDGRYILRGCAFSSNAGDVVCGARIEGVFDFGVNFVGFRVVSPGP
ncbi:MAG: formylglycine-generating enzyme family protein [Chloroflexi bacterium]|nr:formylglycine-generating enzyme family protein [Chloroflexota bacterium]